MAANRRGVALVFVVVAIAVMFIMATVILANTASNLQQANTLSGVTQLRRFGFEVGENLKRPSFRGDIGTYPGRLSHLYAKITTADRNSCGATYSGAQVSNWQGPYHLIPMERDVNYQLFPGLVASDTLQRSPASGAGVLSIVMRAVPLETAQDLGRALDGVATGAGPQITFTQNGNNPIDVQFNVPIDRC